MPKRDLPPTAPLADGDPDAPPSAAERAQAEALRQALERPAAGRDLDAAQPPEAELARALSAAWSPRDLPPAEHRAIVDAAVARRASRGRVIRVSFGASAIVALAASVLLYFSAGRHPPSFRGPSTGPAAAVAVSRSTQPLFPARFAPVGGESARIDRIAMARSADLRDNEFARWGVR